MPRSVSVLALTAAALLATLAAGAQTAADDDPETLFERGRTLRSEHRDAEALEVFARLHAATGAPRALAQVGLAEGALGRWVDAEAHLSAALDGAGDDWVGTHREPLAAALATVQQHLGSLAIECATAGAEVVVAGGVASPLPLARPLRVVAGSVAVEVRASGRSPVQRVVNVSAGGLTREVFALPLIPAAAPAVVAVRPRPAPPRGSRRAWVIGTAVAGGVSAIAATAVYVAGYGAQVRAYNDDATCQGLDMPDPPGSECAGRVDTGNALRVTAIGLWAGGAVLAGVSVALFASEPRERPRALSCAPGLASVSCTVRF